MKLYFAPLEGITTYIYRNTHERFFGGCDAYFTPFITPSDNEKIGRKGFRDILPENNTADIRVQVLTNNPASFLKFEKKAAEYGYRELNINLGCPSGTVVGKGRGSGLLKNTDALDKFLYEIFSQTNAKISVKTRAGYFGVDEIEELLSIYNKYPISLFILHPRCREDFYKGIPSQKAFLYTYENAKAPLCYNGNILSAEDYADKALRYDALDSIMIGRGAVANPAIFREIKGGNSLSTDELIAFTEALKENYSQILDSDVFTLHKLKEIWLYIMENFPDEKKILKTIRKTNNLCEFISAIHSLPRMKKKDNKHADF
ncbi:MAG: tRNA-dihydrouridine synthase family protein [Clostridia bacterium]|nr:tRNA-dihydrouridine synthase family protein [Clostridia bacterium]